MGCHPASVTKSGPREREEPPLAISKHNHHADDFRAGGRAWLEEEWIGETDKALFSAPYWELSTLEP